MYIHKAINFCLSLSLSWHQNPRSPCRIASHFFWLSLYKIKKSKISRGLRPLAEARGGDRRRPILASVISLMILGGDISSPSTSVSPRIILTAVDILGRAPEISSTHSKPTFRNRTASDSLNSRSDLGRLGPITYGPRTSSKPVMATYINIISLVTAQIQCTSMNVNGPLSNVMRSWT